MTELSPEITKTHKTNGSEKTTDAEKDEQLFSIIKALVERLGNEESAENRQRLAEEIRQNRELLQDKIKRRKRP